MYAIIRTGSKQYKVSPGDVVRVEKLEGEPGQELELTDVLAVGGETTAIGNPTLSGATVRVVVTRQAKLPKVIIFKKKRRQGYRKMKGHRQFYTELFVKEITGPNGSAKSDANPKIFDPEKAKLRNLHGLEDEPSVEATEAGEAKPAARKAAPKKAAKKKAGAAKTKKAPAKAKKVAKKVAKKK